MQYSHDVPLPPRKDLNAPDLYIPSESLMWGLATKGTCALSIVRKTILLMTQRSFLELSTWDCY